MALDSDKLNGEHANGREAVTTFGHRDKLIAAPFSPKLGAVEVWRRGGVVPEDRAVLVPAEPAAAERVDPARLACVGTDGLPAGA